MELSSFTQSQLICVNYFFKSTFIIHRLIFDQANRHKAQPNGHIKLTITLSKTHLLHPQMKNVQSLKSTQLIVSDHVMLRNCTVLETSIGHLPCTRNCSRPWRCRGRQNLALQDVIIQKGKQMLQLSVTRMQESKAGGPNTTGKDRGGLLEKVMPEVNVSE